MFLAVFAAFAGFAAGLEFTIANDHTNLLYKVGDKGILHGFGMTHSCFGKFYEELGEWLRR